MMAKPYNTGLSETRAMIKETDKILQVFNKSLSDNELATLVCKSGTLGDRTWSTARNLVTRFFAKRFMNPEFSYSPAEFMQWDNEYKVHERVMMYFIFTALNEEPLFDFVMKCFYLDNSSMDVFDKEDVIDFIRYEVNIREIDHSENKIQRMGAGIFAALGEFGFLHCTDKGTRRAKALCRPHLSDQVIIQLIHFFKKNGISDFDIIHHRVWRLFNSNGYDILQRLAKLPDVYLLESACSLIKIARAAKSDDDSWLALIA